MIDLSRAFRGGGNKSHPADMIDWLGHDSFRLRGEKVVYIDPWKIQGSPRNGDLILLTHTHYDHYSLEDISKVAKPGATVICPASTSDMVQWQPKIVFKPGSSANINGIGVETIRAYNTNKKFHPRESGWFGFIVTLNNLRIYHAGDTDIIPEMDSVKCDIALIPVSGTYVMTADEAVAAVVRIKPKIAIPMHWGEIVGGRADAERFRDGVASFLPECEVVLKDKTV